ncbi:MAG: hypothetical protein ACOYYS_16870 [Chloroflexota bacterium]
MVAIICSKVYFSNENWDRLRVLGWRTASDDLVARADLTFTPLKQYEPGVDITTNPEMVDPVMANILSEHNNIKDLCELGKPWFRCNMLQIDPAVLGSRVKYLLRRSNDSYPYLLRNVHDISDLLFDIDESFLKLERFPGNRDLLEIQAYGKQIVIMGGAATQPEYWPNGYLAGDKYGNEATDIFLPVNVSNEQLGKLLLRVWAAKEYIPIPHPAEFVAFWQRIKEE